MIRHFHFIYSYLDTIPYQHNKVNININNIKKKIKLLFQGVVFVSLYLKNSFNLTLKELNEVESRICFGISFQALAPWYPKAKFSQVWSITVVTEDTNLTLDVRGIKSVGPPVILRYGSFAIKGMLRRW